MFSIFGYFGQWCFIDRGMHFCIAVFPGWLCFNQKHVLRIAVFPEMLFWFVEVSIHPVANKSTACSSNYSLAIIVITMTMKMTTTTTMMRMITLIMMIKTKTQYIYSCKLAEN